MKKILLVLTSCLMVTSIALAGPATQAQQKNKVEVVMVDGNPLVLIPVALTEKIVGIINSKIADEEKVKQINLEIGSLKDDQSQKSYCTALGNLSVREGKEAVSKLKNMCVETLNESNHLLMEVPEVKGTARDIRIDLSAVIMFAIFFHDGGF